MNDLTNKYIVVLYPCISIKNMKVFDSYEDMRKYSYSEIYEELGGEYIQTESGIVPAYSLVVINTKTGEIIEPDNIFKTEKGENMIKTVCIR